METYIKLVKVFPVDIANSHYVNDVLKVVRYFSAGCVAEDKQGRETPFKAEQYETLPKYKIVEDKNDNYAWHGFAIGEIVHLLDPNTANPEYKNMFGKGVLGKLTTQLVHENLLEPVHEQNEEKKVKYTEKDIKEGMQLRCTNNGSFDFWEEGKVYTVTKLNNGQLVIYGDEMLARTSRNATDIANYLNGKAPAKFELVGKMNDFKKKVEAKIEELPKENLGYFKCTNGSIFWTKGKNYPVSYDENAKLYTIADNDGDEVAEPTLELLIQYVTHKINATMIYMNDLKENKAANKDINKVSDLLQAKIDELTTQAEHLFKKRDRLDEHAKNLNTKARRLEEVRDELNKFK